MSRGVRRTLGPVVLDSYVTGLYELPPPMRVPPTEFRVFRQGNNETEYGVYLFDEKAAELVMAAWRNRGIDLTMDYEHQAMQDPPVEAPASASRWVPQIRNGELWATEVTWTERAAAMLAAGEYRYISPAFSFEKNSNRVKAVLNIALTNIPATNDLAPLVAARSKTPPAKGTPMDFEKLFNDLKAKHEETLTQLSAKDTEVAQLSAKVTDLEGKSKTSSVSLGPVAEAMALPATAATAEVVAGVQALSSLRSQLRALTGADSDAGAVGTLHGWRDASKQAPALLSKVAELEGKALEIELDKVLAEPLEGTMLTPAAATEIRTETLKASGGRVTREGIVLASAWRKHAPRVQVGAVKEGKRVGALDLDPVLMQIKKTLGTDVDDEDKAAAGAKS